MCSVLDVFTKNYYIAALGATSLSSLVAFCVGAAFTRYPAFVKSCYPELLSFGAGTLLGDVFLHALPHALHDELHAETERSIEAVLTKLHLWLIFGIFFSLGLDAWVHHQLSPEASKPKLASWLARLLRARPTAVRNLVGDLLHNGLDGVATLVAFKTSWLLGMTTTLSIIAHEIAQEIGDMTVLLHSGLSAKDAKRFNIAASFSCLLGCALAIPILHWGGSGGLLATEKQWQPGISAASALIAFTGGNFLAIALGDMLPQAVESVASHGRKNPRSFLVLLRVILPAALGVVAMMVVGRFEHSFSPTDSYHTVAIRGDASTGSQDYS